MRRTPLTTRLRHATVPCDRPRPVIAQQHGVQQQSPAVSCLYSRRRRLKTYLYYAYLSDISASKRWAVLHRLRWSMAIQWTRNAGRHVVHHATQGIHRSIRDCTQLRTDDTVALGLHWQAVPAWTQWNRMSLLFVYLYINGKGYKPLTPALVCN